MKTMKALTLGALTVLLVFGIGISSASASSHIPLEVGISPQHYNYNGASLTNYKKKLSWYDSDTTTYSVSYDDGKEPQYVGEPFTSYSTYSLPTNYNLASGRTTQTWKDELTVSGVRGWKAMTGSITLTR